MAEYIEREKALEIIDQIFFSTDPTGDEQIGILKCRTAIREIIPSSDVSECLEELKLLKELRKPKKPIISKANLTDFQDFHCPSCNKKIISRLDGEFIAGRLQKYCDDCGQALDWSD